MVMRRHQPHRSKPKNRRAAHISPAYAPNHVIARPDATWHAPSTTAAAEANKENLVRGWLHGLQAHGAGPGAGAGAGTVCAEMEHNVAVNKTAIKMKCIVIVFLVTISVK